MKRTERNIETTYLTAVNWLNNSRILCNDICNIDELFWDNCRFELEEGDEIFQFFLTNCSLSDVEFLEKHFGLLFAYSQLLDLYVLCVDHYGTSWDCVTCYTDIEMAKKNNQVLTGGESPHKRVINNNTKRESNGKQNDIRTVCKFDK